MKRKTTQHRKECAQLGDAVSNHNSENKRIYDVSHLRSLFWVTLFLQSDSPGWMSFEIPKLSTRPIISKVVLMPKFQYL